MRLNPIPFFKDRTTRPRAIIWSGVALIAFMVFWAAMMDGTSTYWFCTVPCHIVHDDNTLAYQESSHTNVSCMACHEPVNANPIEFTLIKIGVAPDAIDTIFKTFELPMNAHNEVALEMPTTQCTQCHNMPNRTFTPSDGLIIDHEIHAEKEIQCTLCHNRIAHPEGDITLVLEGDKKHDNWMSMDGCFRCHSQTPKDAETPPGACEACHPADYKLVPATHEKDPWYTLFGDSTGHTKAAKDESATVTESLKLHSEAESKTAGDGTEKPESEAAENEEPKWQEELIPSSGVNSCYTCHSTSYCTNCHGLEIPHSEAFKKDHSDQGFAKPEVCGRCHARSAEEAKGTGFCNACHHPTSTPPGDKWATEHPKTIKKTGAAACYDCHDERQCSYCHVNGTDAFRALGEEAWNY